MLAIESRVAVEAVNPGSLTRALNDAFGVYQRGQDSRASHSRVYSRLGEVVANGQEVSISDPLRGFAISATKYDPEVFTLQRRTTVIPALSVDDPLEKFENGGVGMVLKSAFSRQERPRELGLFYFHLSGVMTNGDRLPNQGFAKPLPTFKDLLAADYLYQRGAFMLGKYLYGIEGSDGFWGRETKLRGMKKVQGEKQKAVIDGMYSDRKSMADVIIASRPYVFEAWQNFTENGVLATAAMQEIAEGVANSYRMQIEYDKRNVEYNKRMGIMLETDFSNTSPFIPFAFLSGPRA